MVALSMCGQMWLTGVPRSGMRPASCITTEPSDVTSAATVRYRYRRGRTACFSVGGVHTSTIGCSFDLLERFAAMTAKSLDIAVDPSLRGTVPASSRHRASCPHMTPTSTLDAHVCIFCNPLPATRTQVPNRVVMMTAQLGDHGEPLDALLLTRCEGLSDALVQELSVTGTASIATGLCVPLDSHPSSYVSMAIGMPICCATGVQMSASVSGVVMEGSGHSGRRCLLLSRAEFSLHQPVTGVDSEGASIGQIGSGAGPDVAR